MSVASTLGAAPAERVDVIQAIRGVAAVLVIFHHIPVLGLDGNPSVNLFFLISGFMMCYVTAHSPEHFLVKRVVRILPLYWACTLAVFAVAVVARELLHRSEPNPVWLIKSLLFIPFDKGQGAVHPLLFVGWTLNYEVFFYVAFAAAMALSYARRTLLCSAMLLALVGLGAIAGPGSVLFEFYTSSLLIDFVVGMASYHLYVRTRDWRHAPATEPLRVGLGIAGVAIVAVLPWTAELVDAYGRGVVQRLPVTLAYFAILFGLSSFRVPRLLVRLGDASFSIYLFHPFVVQALDHGLGVFHRVDALNLFWVAVAVLLCCALALASFRWVEMPMNSAIRRWLLRDARAPATTRPGTAR